MSIKEIFILSQGPQIPVALGKDLSKWPLECLMTLEQLTSEKTLEVKVMILEVHHTKCKDVTLGICVVTRGILEVPSPEAWICP
jgi:hypothetical protein